MSAADVSNQISFACVSDVVGRHGMASTFPSSAIELATIFSITFIKAPLADQFPSQNGLTAPQNQDVSRPLKAEGQAIEVQSLFNGIAHWSGVFVWNVSLQV